jgi:quinol monooxygenase YgiN
MSAAELRRWRNPKQATKIRQRHGIILGCRIAQNLSSIENFDEFYSAQHASRFERVKMIHVLATIELAPGTRGAFLTEFRKIIADVRAEQGCIEYGPAVDTSTDLTNQSRLGPDKVVVVEKWTDIAALNAHSVAPHMQAYRLKVKDFVRGVNLLVLDPAE